MLCLYGWARVTEGMFVLHNWGLCRKLSSPTSLWHLAEQMLCTSLSTTVIAVWQCPSWIALIRENCSGLPALQTWSHDFGEASCFSLGCCLGTVHTSYSLDCVVGLCKLLSVCLASFLSSWKVTMAVKNLLCYLRTFIMLHCSSSIFCPE